MNEKQMARWEKIRKKGFNWFVIKCTFGFPLVMLAVALIMPYIIGEEFNSRELRINLILAFFIGFFTGWISYEWNEYVYHKTLKTKL